MKVINRKILTMDLYDVWDEHNHFITQNHDFIGFRAFRCYLSKHKNNLFSRRLSRKKIVLYLRLVGKLEPAISSSEDIRYNS